MTSQEHQLIIEMFKSQARMYAGLFEILKSNGIATLRDLEASDALVSATSRSGLDRAVEENYKATARTLGLHIS